MKSVNINKEPCKGVQAGPQYMYTIHIMQDLSNIQTVSIH